MQELLFVITGAAALFGIYELVKKWRPNAGTIVTNAIAFVAAGLSQLGDIISQLSGLAWTEVLSAEHASQLLFSLAIANIGIRIAKLSADVKPAAAKAEGEVPAAKE